MKTPTWTRRQFRKLAGMGALLAGACFAATPAAVAQQTNAPAKPPADKPAEADASELVNWVDFGVGGNFVTGDKSQFQRQSGLPSTAFGGITGFHYENPLGKKGLFTADGRGMFDNHDYDIGLGVSHPEVGYLRGGFRQYRQYYDGSGGFLPSNGAYFRQADDTLNLDRGAMFFEGGLTLKDWPVLKMRFEHDYRSGVKDSTEWGTTTLTPGAAQRRITPSFRLIDEKTDSISADLAHTVSTTDFGVGVRYDWQRNNDGHDTIMQPGQGAASRTMMLTEHDKTDLFSAHAFTDTRINDKLELTTGYEYTTLRNTVSGNRVDNPAVPGTTDTRFVNLAGGSDLDQYTASISLMYSPTENIQIVPSFRAEKEEMNGANVDNPLTTAGGVNVVGAQNLFKDNEGKLDLAESLDLRYVGFTNWTLYARGQWEENRAHLTESSGAAPLPPAILDQVWHQMMQKYSAGANWYPIRGLNFGAAYYHKIDGNHYGQSIPAVLGAYPGYIQEQNFVTDGANLRCTWRVCPQLSLVSRYDFKYGTAEMRGGLLAMQNSANTMTHMIGETVSWTPLNRLYVQGTFNYVLDTLHSPAENFSGGAILESRNNYWTVSSLIGFALDDKTDVQGGYSYYRSADYADNSAIGVPYGAGGEEHMVTGAIGRQINRHVRASVRYAYTSYRDQLFGGHLDFRAHTIFAAMLYRF